MTALRWGSFTTALALILNSAALAQHFRMVQADTGQVVAFADLSDPLLRISFAFMQTTYARRADLDGPDYLCFAQPEKNWFVAWPATAPGTISLGTGTPGNIQWSPVKYLIQPMGPPAGTVTIKSRSVVLNPPLDPVWVTLHNNDPKHDLIVGFVDLRKPDVPPKVAEVTIEKGMGRRYLLDRDAGAAIVTVYDIVLPTGETVERVDRLPIPPRRIWDLIVWENRTAVVDLDKKGNVINSQNRRHSLAVLPLPAGASLPQTIDLRTEAARLNNPGAAALYGTPNNP